MAQNTIKCPLEESMAAVRNEKLLAHENALFQEQEKRRDQECRSDGEQCIKYEDSGDE